MDTINRSLIPPTSERGSSQRECMSKKSKYRRSIRANRFDYRSSKKYFVLICANNRYQTHFRSSTNTIMEKRCVPCLNEYVALDTFIINQIMSFVWLDATTTPPPNVVGTFKSSDQILEPISEVGRQRCTKIYARQLL
jgi:hypothetical protein